ncbi:MAG: hypothetical protein AB7L28_09985 [Kofleriaceae bacterium]
MTYLASFTARLLTAFTTVAALATGCATNDDADDPAVPHGAGGKADDNDTVIERATEIPFRVEYGQSLNLAIDVPSGASFLGARAYDLQGGWLQVYLNKYEPGTADSNADANDSSYQPEVSLSFLGGFEGGTQRYSGGGGGRWYVTLTHSVNDDIFEPIEGTLFVDYLILDDWYTSGPLEPDVPVKSVGAFTYGGTWPVKHPSYTFDVPDGSNGKLSISEGFGSADIFIYDASNVGSDPVKTFYTSPYFADSVELPPGSYEIVAATACPVECHSFWGVEIVGSLVTEQAPE